MAGKELFFEDVNVGDKIPDFVAEPITETQLVMYAGASGDFNPLHTVHAFGEMSGFGGVIGHGMLSMGLTGRALTNWLGNKSLTKFGVNFRAVTKPKDVLTVTGSITNKEQDTNSIDIELLTENQNGDKIIMGNATAVLPTRSSK